MITSHGVRTTGYICSILCWNVFRNYQVSHWHSIFWSYTFIDIFMPVITHNNWNSFGDLQVEFIFIEWSVLFSTKTGFETCGQCSRPPWPYRCNLEIHNFTHSLIDMRNTEMLYWCINFNRSLLATNDFGSSYSIVKINFYEI